MKPKKFKLYNSEEILNELIEKVEKNNHNEATSYTYAVAIANEYKNDVRSALELIKTKRVSIKNGDYVLWRDVLEAFKGIIK